MDRSWIRVMCAFYLLIQYSQGGEAFTITSTDVSPFIWTGDPLNLTVSYNVTPQDIIWTLNGNLLAFWLNGLTWTAPNFNDRLTLQENSLSISSSTPADSGIYNITIITNNETGSLIFNVTVKDKALDIQSNDNGNYKTGDNITLTIWYDGNSPQIFWTYNKIVLAIKTTGFNFVSNDFQNRLILKDSGSLVITNTTKNDAGLYNVSITAIIGKDFVLGSRAFDVNFFDLVQNVTVLQSPGIVREGNSNVTLSCKSSAGDGLVVTWRKDGELVSDSSRLLLLDGNHTLQIVQPMRTDSGSYICNVSNPLSWSSSAIMVTVYYPVDSITVTQSPQIASEENPAVTLTCNTSNANIEAVTWLKDGMPLNSSAYTLTNGNLTLLINRPIRALSGNYSCNISNPAYWGVGFHLLTVYNSVANVTVTQSPQVVTEVTPAINLSCISSIGIIDKVTWLKDGQPVNSNTSRLLDGNLTLQIIQPTRTFSGNYSCIVSNPASSGAGFHHLIVYLVNVTVTVTQSPQIVTEGTSAVNLSCLSSDIIDKVTWLKDGQPVNSNASSLLDGNLTLQIIQPTRAFSGIYSCNVSNPASSGGGLHNLIVYYPLGDVTVTQSPQIVTEGTPAVNLSCISTGIIDKVTWLKDGQPVNSNASRLLGGNLTLQIIQPTREFSGSYSCNVSNPAFSRAGFHNLIVYYPIENVTLVQSPQTVIEGNTTAVNLTCGAPSGYIEKVTWMKNDQPFNSSAYSPLNGNSILQISAPNRTVSGKYSCNVSNAGFLGSASHNLNVYYPLGDVTVTQSPQIVTEGTSAVNLSCISTGIIDKVTWLKDGQPVNSNASRLLDENLTLQIIQPTREFSGSYSCNVSNPASSRAGFHNLIVYYPIENVTLVQSPQTVIEGNTTAVNLTCGAPSGNIEKVTWMKNDQPLNSSAYSPLNRNSILQISAPNRTVSGKYSCNVSNAGFLGSASHNLNVYYPIVGVRLTQSPANVTESSPDVKLSCSASSGYIEVVTWTKDGSSVNSDKVYTLLDGNRTLQILKPKKTNSGNYTCNMSSAVYSASAKISLVVSSAYHATLSARSMMGIMVASVLGRRLLSY
ncbi:hemicentin-1-like isoform X1 [Hyperolius riggenbachi]|uniref:hemicentin-1-like isoform X1 n=1 Tax=Hyperolius riggenbachi TaxID=752182 RepID=UPI0035A34FBF